MTEQQIEFSLQTNKLQLKFWDKISHFGIVGFLLFIPLLFVFFHLRDSLNGTPKPMSVKSGESDPLFSAQRGPFFSVQIDPLYSVETDPLLDNGLDWL